MEITSGLLAKAGLALGAVGVGATGIYFGNDYLSNMISKYDQALIDFLNEDKDNNDIVFEVKKSDGTTSFSATDLNLTGSGTPPASVLVKVQVSSTTNNAFKKSGGNATGPKIEKIKELNESKGWTWECDFEFKKATEATGTTIDTEYKERIFKDNNKGLLGILQQEVNSYNEEGSDPLKKKDLRDIKKYFIKQCGYARGLEKNKKLNAETTLETDGLKQKIDFEFIDSTGNDSAGKLMPKNPDDFDYWFEKRYKNTTATGS